jgi:hypothetical protein
MKILFLLLVLIVSCQSNDSKVTTIPASHIGDWETNCYSNGGGTYGKIILTIEATSIHLTTGVFSNSNCSTVIGEIDLVSDSYVRTENSYTTTLNTYDFTPIGSTSAFNAANYCGRSNWSNGVTQSIFGQTCTTHVPQVINDGDTFEIEAVRDGDTLDTDYTNELFYKI